MTALLHMTDEDLKAMGIPMVGIIELLALCTFWLLCLLAAILYICSDNVG